METLNQRSHRIINTLKLNEDLKNTISNLLYYLNEKELELPFYALEDIAKAINAGNGDFLYK